MKTSIKNVLSVYYASRKMSDKHRRKAMASDMRSLRRQGVKTDQRGLTGYHGDALVSCGKNWDDLKEGGRYWAERSALFRTVKHARQPD